MAIEIAGRHRELMRNIDTVKAFLNGKRGGEAYAMVLGLFEELERLSDDWRWVEEAYRVADRVDSTAWVKSTPEVEALIEKLRPKPKPRQRPVIVDVGDDIPELKVDAADPVRKPSEPAKLVETKKRQPIDGKNLLREFLDNAQRKPRVVSDRSPPAQASRKQVVTKAAEPAKFGFYADLAKRESRLTNAEARKVAISPAFSEPLRALEQTILRDSEPRERVMIVSKDWATNLSDDFLSSCGHALITGLLLAALIIAGCPPLLVLAWVALFFLRRSKLKMELHSRDGEGQLTGRTEIGGLPRALCRACGTLSHLCPWALRRLDSRAQSGLQPAPHRRGRGLFLGGGSTARTD